MKETQLHHADTVKTVNERQVEKQTRFLGSTKLTPGHRCFEIHIENPFELVEANYEREVVFGASLASKSNARKIVTKPGHFYINALNKTNALKKFFKHCGVPLQKVRK